MHDAWEQAERGLGRLDGGNAGRNIPVTWENVEGVPVFFANQYVCQFNQDEFILTFGQMTPPMLLGDEQDRAEQLQRLEYVPVKPLARMAFTYSRLVELINVLQANREQYEQLQQIRNQQMGGENP
jgi:hypothetical protein